MTTPGDEKDKQSSTSFAVPKFINSSLSKRNMARTPGANNEKKNSPAPVAESESIFLYSSTKLNFSSYCQGIVN
jgi:hypothetical protein